MGICLSMGPDADQVTAYTAAITSQLEQDGFIISPKSNLIAAPQQDYIGKTYAAGTISNTSFLT